jgi:hypothetical protein
MVDGLDGYDGRCGRLDAVRTYGCGVYDGARGLG